MLEVDTPSLLILNPAGSEVDVGKLVGWLRDTRWEERIEGRRILVGGGAAATACCFLVFAALVPDEEVELCDDESSCSLSPSFTFSLSFLELGLGGGLAAGSSRRS